MAGKLCAPPRKSDLEEAKQLFGIESIEQLNEIVERFSRVVSILECWAYEERNHAAANGESR